MNCLFVCAVAHRLGDDDASRRKTFTQRSNQLKSLSRATSVPECVFLIAVEIGSEARSGIGLWIDYYNRRPTLDFWR